MTRQPVAERARKWSVTQMPQSASNFNIGAYFANEPIGSCGQQALPQFVPCAKAVGLTWSLECSEWLGRGQIEREGLSLEASTSRHRTMSAT